MIQIHLKQKILLPLASWALMAFLGLCLMVLAEAVAFFSLPKEKRFSFFYVPNENKMHIPIPYRNTDPLLGYAVALTKKEQAEKTLKLFHQYVVYGETGAPVRIVLLGGSSTDGVFYNKTWGVHFESFLDQAGIKAVIFNGGVAGYTSTQELLKLTRDISFLKPDLVISINGVNEHEFTSNEHSFYHKKQLENLRALKGEITSNLLPNLVYKLSTFMNHTKVSLGGGSEIKVPQRFKNNLMMMRAITKSQGGKFIHFLQPTLKQLISDPPLPYQNRSGLKKVIERQNVEMPILSKAIEDLDFTYDFNKLLDFKPQYFADNCHITEEGNRFLAEKVFKILQDKNFLTSDP